MKTSKKSPRPKSITTTPCIGSAESAAGRSLFDSLAGRRKGRSTPVAAHVKISPPPAKGPASEPTATSGPHGGTSPASATLIQSLASKLRRRLGTAGSIELAVTWSWRATPSGRLFYLLRASERRTEDTGYSGSLFSPELSAGTEWPTPNAMEGGSTSRGQDRVGEKLIAGIVQQISLDRWATPTAIDNQGGKRMMRGNLTLSGQAELMSWPTPTVRDERGEGGAAGRERLKASGHLPSILCETAAKVVNQSIGAITESFTSPTGPRGVLNAELSRWLQGFPSEWDHCSPGWPEWELIQKFLNESSNSPDEIDAGG